MRMKAVQWKRFSGLLLTVVMFASATAWAEVPVTFPDKNLETAILQAIGQEAPPIYDTKLKTLTALNASFSGLPNTAIVDLTGIEFCTEIKSLQLQGNEITDIAPLAELSKLENLYLRGNLVSSLEPLANLRQLHLVFLEDNQIQDISALASNPGIDTEDVINLTGNELNQMAYCTLIPEMESRGVTIYRSSACGTRVVVIPDLNLDRKIRAALVQLLQPELLLEGYFGELERLKTGDLLETDLASLTTLDASDTAITDLTGIRACINLKELYLAGNRIVDLTPLSSLSPTILNLSGNAIRDLRPLRRMQGLSRLEIQNQFDGLTRVLSDLSVLKELSGLVELYAGDNAISDLTPLRALAFLRVLSLSHNEISDITPLQDLVDLLSLDLVGNDVSDLSALSAMTNLARLGLGDNAVADLTPIEPLHLLQILDLSNNSLKSIESLARLVHLEGSALLSPSEIYLHNDTVYTYSEDEAEKNKHPKHKNQITDVTALAGLPSLAVVTLYNMHNATLPAGATSESEPEVGNDVGDISPLVGNGGMGNVGVARGGGQMVPDLLDVRGNQLSQENLCVDIPLLQTRDLNVYFDGTCCDETFLLLTEVAEPDTGTVDPPEGARRYCAGDQKRITATPAPGYRFDHWEGDVSGTEPTITVTISADTHVTAVFGSDTQRYKLTLKVDPTGTGECTADPSSATDGTYSSSAQVTVTAKAKTGYAFDHWDLNTADKLNPKKVTMNSDITLTAHFKAQGKLYRLTTGVKGEGSLKVLTTPDAANQTFEDGTVVSVQATADLGWRFDHWEGALTTAAIGDTDVAQGQVTMTEPKTLTAVFVEDGYDYALAAVTEGLGIIVVSPMLPPHGFQRTSDRLYRFKEGTKLHVLAVAGVGSAFDHWTGNLTGSVGEADFVMDANKSIRAVFASGTIRHLTIAVQGPGTVSPPAGEYSYVDGKQMTLVATAAMGARFEGWSGSVQGTSNIAALVMDSDKTVTATFAPVPTITALHPNAGAVAGGEIVVIEGLRLQDASEVLFSGVSLEILEVTDTSITVRTPVSTQALPNTEGPVDVLVTTPLGEAAKLQGFTYMGQPIVSVALPSKGSAAGGNRVLLRGKNLAIATQVLFGGVAGVIEEASREDTRLYITTPAHAPGSVSIELLSVMDTATLPGGFEYVKVPLIYSIFPNQASTVGGDVVRITGDGLAQPRSVTFDGTAAIISQASETELELVVPSHAAGTVDVTVTTDGGTATLSSGFNYYFSSAQLTCRVTSAKTQQSITDATVRLDPVGRVVTENQFGAYVFPNVRPDDYAVVVAAPSYETQTVAVTVHANENAVIDIQLQPVTKADEDCGSLVKRLDTRIAETALPLSIQGLPSATISPDGPLAVRLSSEDGVDPGSVWAALTSARGTASGGTWRPVATDDNSDGWVVFTPTTPLVPGESITLTVGGVSAKGAILGPVTQDYTVAADKASLDGGERLREETKIAPIPVVAANAQSVVYRVGPSGVFDAPVVVRVPVEADTDASAVEIFYYSEAAEHTGWYRGVNVAGWIVPDSVKLVQADGQTFVEMQVNHSGVVQIGQRMAFGAAAPFDVHATGSRMAWLGLAGVALVLGGHLAHLLRGRARA